jgi:phage minor structural protein
MSYPILYSAKTTDFENNGYGVLSDCITCEVTEEANGIFEMTMTYPINGIHYLQIETRSIIKVQIDQFREPQLFRVYAINKHISGAITVAARHISYDLSGIPVSTFSADNVALALSGLKNNAAIYCPFEFWTDKNTTGHFSVSTPSSIRSCLGGVSGSILDVYGGDYEFDNYKIKLHNSRGVDRGIKIRYGKNMTNMQQEQNCASVATGVYPYWSGEVEGETVLVELPEKIINAPGLYDFRKIQTLDMSSVFEQRPTEDELREKANNYVRANNIGVPTVSISVSFVQLSQSEEYKNLKALERVSLFDTVSVLFPALSVSASAKVVKIVYDIIADRIKTISIGSVRSNIADTIAIQHQEIQQIPTKTDLERAKEAATSWLTNGKGYAYFRKDDSGNIIDILFMDTKDTGSAVNVMRVGQSGIGFSHNGVNGPYESAWTIDGHFVADFITTGSLSANLIKAGAMISNDGSVNVDLNENKITVSQDDDYSKLEISSYGITGKYESVNAPQSIESLRIRPGNEVFSTDIFAPKSGIYIGAGGDPRNETSAPTDYVLSLGSGLCHTVIGGRTVRFMGKNCSWQYSSELGKYVLCGE